MKQKMVLTEWFELSLDKGILEEISKDPNQPLILKDILLQKANTKNHNGRIYPREILVREIGKYSHIVKDRRAMGELDHPDCYLSNNFDVLAKDGWKKFEDLSVGDEIFTLAEDKTLELQPIEKIINEPYKGHGYRVKGANIDSSFTPNHRLLLETRYGKREYVTIEEIYNNRSKYNHHKIIKNGALWLGSGQETIEIPGISEERHNPGFKNDVREPLLIDILTFVQFLGIWLAEGCLVKDTHSVFITQNPGKKADLIRDMLSRIPLDFSEYVRPGGCLSFVIRDIRLVEYLEKLGHCHEKYIPYEIKQLDPIYLEVLLDWFIMGDGRKQENGYGGRQNLFSTSKRLIEDMHECLIKCGGSGNWQEIITTKDYVFADHLIEAKNKRPLYQLNISLTNGIWLKEGSLKIEKIEHDGNVYCLSVKNGNFYVKQNRKSYWTGNSSIIELKNVSHIVSDIYMRGDEAIGSLEILKTPQGQIVRNLIQQNIKIGISSRGVGSLQQESGTDVVQDDFELIAFDIVSSPSTPGAYLIESVNDKLLVDRHNNLRNILHGILKDSYFE